MRRRIDLRRHLDALVVPDELERLLERDRPRRDQAHELVGARRTHVRQLLLLAGVHVHVLATGILADHHPFVDLDARSDEENAAFLEVREREGGRRSAPVGDEAAGRTRAELAVPGLVALEDVVHDPRTARLGEELGAETDEPARGHEVLHSRPARAVVDHLLHPALAQRQHLGDDADVVLRGVDRDALDRLVPLAVDELRQHLGLADRELEALAAHDLDEHGQLQLAAALHLPDLGALGGEDAQRDVADELLLEPRLDHARGHLVALGAREGRGVDPEGDRERGLVDRGDG